MLHVVEIGNTVLPHPETQSPDAGVHVPRIMKQHPVDIFSIQRKTQFGAIKELRRAAQRKSRIRIARTGLVLRKTPLRKIAAAEEPFGNRYRVGRNCVRRNVKRRQNTESSLTR